MSQTIRKEWGSPESLPKGLKPAENGAWVIASAEIPPEDERGGDVVRIKGMQVPRRMPLLAQHIHTAPDGTPTILGSVVEFADAQIDWKGKSVPAKLARWEWADTPLALSYQRLWGKHIDTVSIGAMVHEASPLAKDDPYGGQDYTKTELFELSIVTVPANPAATALQAIQRELGDALDRGPDDEDEETEDEAEEERGLMFRLDDISAGLLELKNLINRRLDDIEDTYATRSDSAELIAGRRTPHVQATDLTPLLTELQKLTQKFSHKESRK